MPGPTNGKDKLIYGDGDDVIDALAGDDTVYAGSGNDTLYGGAGRNRLYGEDGGDVIWGGDDRNTIHGGHGIDNLFGGGGDDEIHGGADTDYIYGFEGKNRLYGDGGDDIVNGGGGNDTLEGGDGEDILFGNGGKDRLDGAAGDDSLDGADGNDTLFGGSGIDRLYGAQGKDSLDGGEGIDYAFYIGDWADYRITTAANGVTTVEDLRNPGLFHDGTDRMSGVERLIFADRTVTLSIPDPDGTFANAHVIPALDIQDGSFTAAASLELPDDVDIWQVVLQAGQTVTASVDSGLRNDPRTDIAIYDAAGRFIVVNNDDSQDDDDGPVPSSTIDFTPGQGGIFYFAISGFGHVPTENSDLSGPNHTGFSGARGDYVFNLSL